MNLFLGFTLLTTFLFFIAAVKAADDAKTCKEVDGKPCKPKFFGPSEIKKCPKEKVTCMCMQPFPFIFRWQCFNDSSNSTTTTTTTQRPTSSTSGATTTTTLSPIDAEWEAFKVKHNKHYETQEKHDIAKSNYKNTKTRVAANNAEFDKGNVGYKLAINQYADIDEATFHSRFHGINKNRTFPQERSVQNGNDARVVRQGSFPATWDWRNTNNGNMVSAVRNQDPCGDCWTFATMGSIESQMLMKKGQNILLSEQQLVDCDGNQNGGGGCNGGGWPDLAMTYLQQAGGAMSDASYPYSSGDPNSPNYDKTGTCQFNANGIVVQIAGQNSVQMPTSNDVLQAALYNNGPQAIVVDASQWPSQYSSGYLPCQVNPQLDHAVLLIGYALDSNNYPYWIIKNQWSTYWGVEGFGYIPFGQDCGITSWQAISPIIQ